MPTFPDLSAFLAETNGETLTLPINGELYTFDTNVSIDTGVRITRMREEVARYAAQLERGETPEASLELLDDASETAMVLDLIGENNLTKLKAAGIKWPLIVRIGHTLIAWHMSGPDAALAAWSAGTDASPPPAGSSSRAPRTSRSGSTTSKKPSSSKRKPRKSGGATSSTRGQR